MLDKKKVKYDEFLMLSSDKKTHLPLYLKYIPDRPLQNVFLRLASLMTPFWNSIPYKSIRELAKMVDMNYSRLAGKIKLLDALGVIAITNEYLYINPCIATKSKDVEYVTLKHFLSETGTFNEDGEPIYGFTIILKDN